MADKNTFKIQELVVDVTKDEFIIRGGDKNNVCGNGTKAVSGVEDKCGQNTAHLVLSSADNAQRKMIRQILLEKLVELEKYTT